MAKKRRVVISGFGVISPVGVTQSGFWDSVSNGRSGIDRISSFDASTFPTRIAGEIKRDLRMLPWRREPDSALLAKRKTAFAIYAAQQALEEARLSREDVSGDRIGTFLGTGLTIHPFDQEKLARLSSAWQGQDSGFDELRVNHEDKTTCIPGDEMPAEHVATALGTTGVCQNIESACAASAHAIGQAYRYIQRDVLDVALAGGVDAMINFLGLAGFCLVGATSTYNDEPSRACRPFDRTRNGTVISEGGAVLVLEEMESARARGVEIYAEILGYGSSVDAYRLTDPSPDGSGAYFSMFSALADAGISPEDVNYINAHGTATRANDRVETAAIKRLFGRHAHSLAVSSSKSVMGHLVAAAGAVEAVVTALAIKKQTMPPTINYANPDPFCDLDYVPNMARKSTVQVALSNSFGFGGQNGTLVLGRA